MIQRIKDAITSKKFFCLIIAIVLRCFDKITSGDLVIVMCVYMGVEIAQYTAAKYLEK